MGMRKFWVLSGVALGLLSTSGLQAAAPADAQRVVTTTLSNGMHVVVWPDHDIPNVALYNFVKVGSRNEAIGKTGLAHFFEHMMFNGTRTRPQGEFDRIMEASGGSNNAFTSEDVTVYQDWFPRTALSTVLQLEADRLQNLAFIPKVVESERGVVYSERRLRVEDDNEAKLAERVQATAFLAHPYGIPVIGWPSDIQAWTLQDLQQFFTTYYAPNNCTLVLVGDVQPQEALASVRKYFEPIPAQPPPEALRAREPKQEGERRVTLMLPAQTPLLQFAYHSPEVTNEQFPALEVLMRVLVAGESSRLHQALVERDKLAIAVDGDLMRGFDPGLLWFYVSLPAQADVHAVERAFDAELQRVIDHGIGERELDKARNMMLSEFWQQLSTINGKASAIGRYAVFYGDYRKLFAVPDEYAHITRRQVQAAAQAVLNTRNRTVGVVLPDAAAANDVDRSQVGVATEDAK